MDCFAKFLWGILFLIPFFPPIIKIINDTENATTTIFLRLFIKDKIFHKRGLLKKAPVSTSGCNYDTTDKSCDTANNHYTTEFHEFYLFYDFHKIFPIINYSLTDRTDRTNRMLEMIDFINYKYRPTD